MCASADSDCLQKALYLPNIAGKVLSDGSTKHTTEMCFGKTTILAMLNTKVSEVAFCFSRQVLTLTRLLDKCKGVH